MKMNSIKDRNPKNLVVLLYMFKQIDNIEVPSTIHKIVFLINYYSWSECDEKIFDYGFYKNNNNPSSHKLSSDIHDLLLMNAIDGTYSITKSGLDLLDDTNNVIETDKLDRLTQIIDSYYLNDKNTLKSEIRKNDYLKIANDGEKVLV